MVTRAASKHNKSQFAKDVLTRNPLSNAKAVNTRVDERWQRRSDQCDARQ